jgi:hypothetical protein
VTQKKDVGNLFYKKRGLLPLLKPPKGKKAKKTPIFARFFEEATTQSVAMGYRKTLQNLLTMARPQKSCNLLQYQQNHFKKSNG